jgi:DNA-binding XRE family transcriptional regulator
MMRVARTLLDLSQEQLAERARISRRTIVRIEAGGRGVAFDAVERVRLTLQRGGAAFLPLASDHGPSVALRKPKP